MRQYTEQPLEGDVYNTLLKEIKRVNEKSGLYIRLFTDEPTAFHKFLLQKVSKFRNAVNYISIAGPDTPELN